MCPQGRALMKNVPGSVTEGLALERDGFGNVY